MIVMGTLSILPKPGQTSKWVTSVLMLLRPPQVEYFEVGSRVLCEALFDGATRESPTDAPYTPVYALFLSPERS